jgi:hypothetical protein
VAHVPPAFLSTMVALANFMRLSLQKAAHANLANATCRKSGSHQRNDFPQSYLAPSEPLLATLRHAKVLRDHHKQLAEYLLHSK